MDSIAGYSPAVDQIYSDTIDLAARSDQIGLDSFWVAENHFSHTNGVCPSPAVLLSYILGRTEQIRVGAGVCVLPISHPLRVAEDFAVLDMLGRGRLDFGVGTGFLDESFRGFGIPTDEKRERFEESIAIIKKAWGAKRFSHRGTYHSIDEIEMNVAPLDRDSMPFWVAVSSADSARRALLNGYSILLSPYIADLGLNETLELLAQLRSLSASGEAPPNVEIAVVMHLSLGRDGGVATEVGKKALARRIRSIGTRDSRPMRSAVAGRLADLAFRRGILLFGRPAEIAPTVDRVKSAGASRILMMVDFGATERDQVKASLDGLCEIAHKMER